MQKKPKKHAPTSKATKRKRKRSRKKRKLKNERLIETFISG